MSDPAVTVEVDCHSYAYHVHDDAYPETGPDNLTRMAETYGVLIEHLPEHRLAGWAWWYRITGPRESIVRFLVAEYCGDVEQAREMVAEMAS